jgi:excisionase family DNA binding protein
MKKSEDRLTFTINEAAKVLGVSRGTMYEAIRTETIPSLRMGRRIMIPKHALLDFMGAPLPATPRGKSYDEGAMDERARITDLIVKLLAQARGF